MAKRAQVSFLSILPPNERVIGLDRMQFEILGISSHQEHISRSIVYIEWSVGSINCPHPELCQKKTNVITERPVIDLRGARGSCCEDTVLPRLEIQHLRVQDPATGCRCRRSDKQGNKPFQLLSPSIIVRRAHNHLTYLNREMA